MVDALACFLSAALIASVRVTEEPPRSSVRPSIRRAIGEGLSWTYRHRTLAPPAISTHIWFIANAAALTVFTPLALRDLGLSPWVYGVVLAMAGCGGFVGALLAPRAGRRLGEGTTMLVGRSRPRRRGLVRPSGRSGPGRLRVRTRPGGPEQARLPPSRHPGGDAGPDERDHAFGQPHHGRRRGSGRRGAGRPDRFAADVVARGGGRLGRRGGDRLLTAPWRPARCR
ncbi:MULTISPECIES: MFS transporter [Pseudonocardia]|uniref:MFS transporter n=1 Tax=Pseudonocardia TaxID=1847 RepID=UPI0035A2581F